MNNNNNLTEIPVIQMFNRFNDYLDFDKFETWYNTGPGIKPSEILYSIRRDQYLELFKSFLRIKNIITIIDNDGNEHYFEDSTLLS